MIGGIIRWWHKRQRDIDLQCLWPSCCELAPDLDHAKMAFAMHAFHDHAWMEMGESNVKAFIDRLEPPT